MISVSLCMIVKDEEKVLGRCLESVKNVVDEIIIADTGSKDRTKEIARQYTDKVYDFEWKDDFSAARNFSLSKGTKDYLMWIDADDVLPEKSVWEMLKLKEELPPDTDVVMLPYAVAFDSRGKSTFTYFRERIVKNSGDFRFEGRVHEAIPPAGNVHYSDVLIEHRKIHSGDSSRNLRIYEDMEEKGEVFDSRSLYYYGRELLFHEKYKKGAEVLQTFLNCPDGWIENKIDATRQLAYCFYGLGNDNRALCALLEGLAYDVPRGETCCDLGRHFMDRGKYEQAVYWYGQALSAKKADRSGAFITEECYGYLPAISLCICYDRLGKYELAETYNEMAEGFSPGSAFCSANREYFRERRSDGQKKNPNIH